LARLFRGCRPLRGSCPRPERRTGPSHLRSLAQQSR
jgi:hypothetical protein